MSEEITYHADPNVISYIGDKMRHETYYLGLGTEIPANADLNDYLTPGIYYFTGTAYQTLKNHPTNEFNGYMVVTRGNANTVTVQTLYSGDSKVSYRRSHTGTAWLTWTCISGVDPIVAYGYTSGWQWIKYASGWCECEYGGAPFGDPVVTRNALGNLYRSDFVYLSYPFNIVTPRRAFGQVVHRSGNYGLGLLIDEISDTKIHIAFVSPVSSTNIYNYVYVKVTGYWK